MLEECRKMSEKSPEPPANTMFGILLMGGTLMGGNGFWAFFTSRSDVVGHLESDTVLSCKCCTALVFLEQDEGCRISLAVRCLSVPCWGAPGHHRSPVPPHPVPPQQKNPDMFRHFSGLFCLFGSLLLLGNFVTTHAGYKEGNPVAKVPHEFPTLSCKKLHVQATNLTNYHPNGNGCYSNLFELESASASVV